MIWKRWVSEYYRTVAAPSSLSVNLLSYLKRVYTAFDTEYNVVDSKETDLLCLTTSTHTGVLLRTVVSDNLN